MKFLILSPESQRKRKDGLQPPTRIFLANGHELKGIVSVWSQCAQPSRIRFDKTLATTKPVIESLTLEFSFPTVVRITKRPKPPTRNKDTK